jgi:hypothetical protein
MAADVQEAPQAQSHVIFPLNFFDEHGACRRRSLGNWTARSTL